MRTCLCLAAIIVMISLTSAQVCTSNYWNCWNEIVKNNNNQRPTPITSTNPTKIGALGTFSWVRRTGGLSTRANQYAYQLNQNANCVIYCGIQSYPHYDSNGLLFCKRNSFFWDGMTNFYGNIYTNLCIPTVVYLNNIVCSAATNNLNNYTPSCSKSALPSNYLNSGNDCCYDNLNTQFNNTPVDQTDFRPTTNYDNTMLPAYLFNAP